MNRILVFLTLIVSIFAGCNPAAKLVKQGDAKKEANQYEDASLYYYNALLNSPQNEKAKAGLRETAQLVLNDKFTNFNKMVVENNVDEAVKVYVNAQRYSATSASVGVPLRWPSEYDEVYADIRAEYISKLYDEALLMMKEKRFEQAEQTFERIAALDSSYRGITVLRINTVLEPLYQHGVADLQQGKYKQAMQSFQKVVAQDEEYKDAKALMQEANDKATTTIAVFPVEQLQQIRTEGFDNLSKLIQTKLEQRKFAYVKIEQSDEVKNNLQSRGWLGIVDEQKAIEAGKTLGLKYIVLVTVQNIEYVDAPAVSEQKSAYEAFSENILNPYTGTYAAITKFRKVSYQDTYEQRAVTLSVKYSLISVADNKVVLSEEKRHTQKDEVHQLVFEGNINNLFENLPNGNYLPPPNQDWRDLFTNHKRELLPKARLLEEANYQLGTQISQSILKFFK